MTNTDEKSFSLNFQPIQNVKPIKEYEEEIMMLKNEVFDLKTQLTHGAGNIPQILYENNIKVEELERNNKNMNETILNMKTTVGVNHPTTFFSFS